MGESIECHKYSQVERVLLANSVDLIQLQKQCDNLKQKICKNTECDEISQMIRQFICDIKQTFIEDKFICNKKLKLSLENYILYNLHDTIVPTYYQTFKNEDEMIFEKCLSLQHIEICHNYGFINLPASIVELASLDLHKTVHEKLACLTACYDFIFAEIKFAMVELIAENETSDVTRENGEIPIVNNKDIIPVLVEVIFKSKYSTHILTCFNEAIESLMEIGLESVKTFRKTFSEMDLKQYYKITKRLDDSSFSNNFERLSMARISRQISKSHEYIGNL